MKKGSWRRWVAALASGLSFAAVLPPHHCLWLLPFSFGLLAWALGAANPLQAFFLGWVAGTAAWAASVPWVMEVMTRYGHLPGWVAGLLLLLMASVLGVLWGVASWLTAQVPPVVRLWVLPLTLAAAELLQGLPPWNFPWNPLAASLTPWPLLLAPLPLWGVVATGLWWRLLAAALWGLLRPESRRLAALLGAGAAGALGMAAGLAPSFQPMGGEVVVGALQPHVSQEERWDPGNGSTIEANLWALSQQAVARGAQWVVWPESANPRLFERDGAYQQQVQAFCKQNQVWLTFGSIGFGPKGEYYNTLYSAAPWGEVARYHKVQLVPFGEYVPLLGQLAAFRPLVREVGGFTPGKAPHLLPGPCGATAPAVCYEVAFGRQVAQQVRSGAQLLVTITNDAWYGTSGAPAQHLSLAILRAAEARRYLVRAANTGISAIVSPKGELVASLPVGERGMLVAPVRCGGGLTPAVRWFWPLGLLPLGLAAVAILLVGRRKIGSEEGRGHAGGSFSPGSPNA